MEGEASCPGGKRLSAFTRYCPSIKDSHVLYPMADQLLSKLEGTKMTERFEV